MKPGELKSIRDKIAKDPDRYRGSDLDGALMECDYALVNAGFTDPDIKKTGDVKQMVLYVCVPNWTAVHEGEVISRLETAWREDAAFAHEVHSVTVEDYLVALDFVTWWDEGTFYTGRIEVALARNE